MMSWECCMTTVFHHFPERLRRVGATCDEVVVLYKSTTYEQYFLSSGGG